ncbi:hypothetical protein [Carnimonas bestiolae]|uniref:hypothetical protein n=1 Tax=Carnimonas bestiolae TaxID=3402172 RepID=UPI003EDBB520
MIVADSQAPIEWLMQVLPYIGGALAIFVVVMLIVGKFWIFPHPSTRHARNRRKRGRRTS